MASDAVLLDSFRARIAKHMSGEDCLKPIGFMAFGDGGHNEDLEPIPPTSDQDGLTHEVLRKELTSVYQKDEYSVSGKGTITREEIVGVQLSEAALLDTDGNFLAIKTFAPKVKESNEMYDIEVTLRF